ncbi:hypothetical protein Glove_502g13 [Diversispora epigaea]|uniref:Transposase putative helix-turn-helix domain-containing protein n=1 Tax=Diversispora epigaea TaxID=1348612 RepID=A0A397GKK8_9GLOM|nr:hypothetical protein Glove_502g13 [Diversispora epigaea]
MLDPLKSNFNKHGSVSSSHFLTKTTFLTFLTKPPFYNLAQLNTTYQSAHKIQETYDVSVETLRRWADSGRIAIVRTPGGKRLYSITNIQEIFRDNQQTQITQKAKICYAKVSSEHQRDDLERQIANLRQYYPEYEIISDIGSGLNWKRRGTDCADLDPSLWNGSLRKMGLSSWYSVRISVLKVVKPENLRKTYSQSSRYLWQDIMECVPPPIVEEDEKLPKPKKNKSSKIPAGKTQRIRLFPTQEEKSKLKRWMGTARWTYNRCLVAVEKEGIERTKKALRAQCLNAANFNNTELQWVLETPYDIRNEAINDLLKSYSSNFAAKRKKFKMKFRFKKDQQQSIAILSKHWDKSKGVYTFLCKIKSAENLPAELHYDSRLVMNQLGEFYLCIPQPLEIWAENQGPIQSDAVIALDPGVRTFITIQVDKL